jgi:preprotein translocase subunit SecF
MFIARRAHTFLIISGLLAVFAVASIFIFGLRPGIEFAGGTALTVSVADEGVSKDELERAARSVMPDAPFSIRALGETEYNVRTTFVTDENRAALERAFEELAGASVLQTSIIGPTIGLEFQRKAMIAVILVVLAIIFYIAFAFRRIEQGTSAWVLSGATIVALIFDIIIAIAAFALLGALFGVEVGLLFIVALLTTLGYSVNDSIVVFDKLRERLLLNQKKKVKEDLETSVGTSINGTLARCINTSLTTSLVLIALAVFGNEATRVFSLTLLAGVLSGTYSSLFLASPLVIAFEEYRAKRRSSQNKEE